MELKVVTATDAMIDELIGWLKSEYRKNGDGVFVNAHVIERAQQRGHVHCALIRNQVVGFSVGKYGEDIICVRQTRQRKGVGTALFQNCVARARADGKTELRGEAMPPESITFWEKHGWQRDGRFSPHGAIGMTYRIPRPKAYSS